MPPHRVLEHPVFLQKIHAFGTLHHYSPAIFNSVCTSWSETQIDFSGAAICWKKFIAASPKNEKKVKTILVWCCRNCNNPWIFVNLIDSGLDLDKKYDSLLRPLDVLFLGAKNLVKPQAKIGIEDEKKSDEDHNNKSVEEQKRKKAFERYVEHARVLLEKGCPVRPQALGAALKCVDSLDNLEIIEMMLRNSGQPEVLNMDTLIPLTTGKNIKLCELFLKHKADPLFRAMTGGLFPSETTIVNACIKGDVKLINCMFRKAHPEFKMMSSEPRHGLASELSGLDPVPVIVYVTEKCQMLSDKISDKKLVTAFLENLKREIDESKKND